MGVREMINLKLSQFYLRGYISDLTSTVQVGPHQFILLRKKSDGPGSGHSARLCDTKVPVDGELRSVLRRYLSIRPDSDSERVLLSTKSWGEPISNDGVHHIVEKHARSSGLYADAEEPGRNLTPNRLIRFFKYRFTGNRLHRSTSPGVKMKYQFHGQHW